MRLLELNTMKRHCKQLSTCSFLNITSRFKLVAKPSPLYGIYFIALQCSFNIHHYLQPPRNLILQSHSHFLQSNYTWYVFFNYIDQLSYFPTQSSGCQKCGICYNKDICRKLKGISTRLNITNTYNPLLIKRHVISLTIKHKLHRPWAP